MIKDDIQDMLSCGLLSTLTPNNVSRPPIPAESVTIRAVVRRAPATDGHTRRSEFLRIFDNSLMELLRKVRKR